jgi:hypothetical protein
MSDRSATPPPDPTWAPAPPADPTSDASPSPSPAGPPPIVPPINPWQAPGGPVASGPFPTAYSGPVPPGAIPPVPGTGWPQPPKPRSLTAGLIAAIAVFVVVVLGCIGAIGVSIVRSDDSSSNAAPGDRAPGFPLLPSDGSTEPGADADKAAQGPQASPYGVKDVDDLEGVCDENTYFPQSPKYQGKAPHPVAIMVRDRKDMDTRISEAVYEPGYSNSKTRQDAWNVYFHPAKAQLVACVDLVSGGGKIKTCKFDDPKPDSLPLRVGNYQITLFEASTHKQLFTKKVTGDDRSCPTVVLLGNDRNLYSAISERYYVELLKKYVEK